ncbi:Ohr subfamily peroxiredoxin [Spinactinospora alkalitolerans]|uniref:Ohr subfamily peroxiredoxin n=1 Tax=Spinactinospora alkalitolerans TaxID=687207 RepID=A0A852TVC2_9ACTN|nr:Ohr subfamily peroxiredoxin [Spinactinospora alkalitolerans]
MKVVYTAEGTVEGEGRQGKGRSDDGRLNVDLSVPKGMGGDDGPGTNPEQLFAVGYAACFHGALKGAARQDKVELTGTSVTARVDIGKGDDGFGLAVTLDVTVPGLDRAAAEGLVAKAHRNCPYSKATRGNIEVTLNTVTD